MTLRILHVEDDEDIREIAKLSLEMTGEFELMQCASGPEAIAAAPGYAPDLLLMDVMMPGMSGEQLLAELRKLPGFADTPAIFMTARAQPTEVKALRDQGALEVIVKPFDPLSLATQIQDILAAAPA
ncbi:two-component response regulator [Oceanicola granulosus HTCC2516]|uniref:Two-component response regulator n=1 Tax=Oceanicola granulosus (strain ATCC BAA-861 / DSM 15982 / KCTC 12143 / HTCC2516) TaxID=314256 RepID=Q2CCA8_OCEGH|nr:response regulator [Oceanicola granulosus]EAR50325.1 two-component response regulator [Oceanicola granulosus HTCC2516]